MELLHRGSVKDLYRMDRGELCFEFSDRYSIFDWGEMPDPIEQKGEALASMGALFFDVLSKQDVAHHFMKQIDPRRLQVAAVDVPRVSFNKDLKKYDYKAYTQKPVQTLVPLEVIFRMGVPQGSSLLKRDPSLKVGQRFETPRVEFSTKLEATDRLLSDEEACEIAGLNLDEMQRLKTITTDLAFLLEGLFSKMDVTLWDGKFEFAFIEGTPKGRNFMLVDSIGPDELRLTYQDIQLSKECLRKLYMQSEWKQNVAKAKSMAFERGETDWKKICKEELGSSPLPLDTDEKKLISEMYKTLAQQLSVLIHKENLFQDALSLEEWVKRWQALPRIKEESA